MSAEEIEKRLAAISIPFWILLKSGEPIFCRELTAFDGMRILAGQRNICAYEIDEISQTRPF
jgi:hypothetical protein